MQEEVSPKHYTLTQTVVLSYFFGPFVCLFFLRQNFGHLGDQIKGKIMRIGGLRIGIRGIIYYGTGIIISTQFTKFENTGPFIVAFISTVINTIVAYVIAKQFFRLVEKKHKPHSWWNSIGIGILCIIAFSTYNGILSGILSLLIKAANS